MSARSKKTKETSVRTVVHICREYASLAGAGGMKDVTEGLAKAAAEAGIDVHVFLPFYRVVDAKHDPDSEAWTAFFAPMNFPDEGRREWVSAHRLEMGKNLTVHLLKSDRYRFLAEGGLWIERHGVYQYTEEESRRLMRPDLKGKGYFDFFAMNALLVKASLYAMGAMGLIPDVIHCHDGHAALAPLIAQTSAEGFDPALGHAPCVLTIHNAGRGYHQEIADFGFASAICGTPWQALEACRLDGKFDPLMAGALYSQVVNTVSENYARELQFTGQDAITGWLGHAMRAQGVDLQGVTNGVDAAAYDPVNGAQLGLAAAFSPRDMDLEGKEVCKKATLQALSRREAPERVELAGAIDYVEGAALLTFISRLESQKGMDLLADAMEELMAEDESVQLLGLGSGEAWLENRFRSLAERFRGRVCVAFGFNPAFASQVYAAGDFFLLPSRFEPCGLTDFYAQLSGNVPIVCRVGGLVKTVDGKFGYSYLGGQRELLTAVRRALAAYREEGKPALRRIQRDAAKNIYRNFTWDKVFSQKYLSLYEEASRRALPVLPY